MLDRSPSSVIREPRRNTLEAERYSANTCAACRVSCWLRRKLVHISELFDLMLFLLRKSFSPQQITGKLSAMV